MLRILSLQNFRNYSRKQFDFTDGLTVVVGLNTAGKTNLCEAILLLSTGKSFRADKDAEMITFGQEIGRIGGFICQNDRNIPLEVTLAQGSVTGGRFLKRFTVNGVGKSRNNFMGHMPAVLFHPEELAIITDGPSARRHFLDDALEQVDVTYRIAKLHYEKALRQRNALLYLAKEAAGVSSHSAARQKYAEQFVYWDKLLIESGSILTRKREEFLDFVQTAEKDIFPFRVFYDKSIMSEERLLQYKDVEIGAGVTLVGPHRDDVQFFLENEKNAQNFGSRGQERLIVLQLKLLQVHYIKNHLGVSPMFVLDDIFSELDSRHIALVLERIKGSQIILTTTHGEFVKNREQNSTIIRL